MLLRYLPNWLPYFLIYLLAVDFLWSSQKSEVRSKKSVDPMLKLSEGSPTRSSIIKLLSTFCPHFIIGLLIYSAPTILKLTVVHSAYTEQLLPLGLCILFQSSSGKLPLKYSPLNIFTYSGHWLSISLILLPTANFQDFLECAPYLFIYCPFSPVKQSLQDKWPHLFSQYIDQEHEILKSMLK